jgi:diguanylate cyclase (GGDEF)-like protein/PAS domain S-box-containing protein
MFQRFFLFIFIITLVDLGASENIKIGLLAFKFKEITKKEWAQTQNYLNQIIPDSHFEIIPMSYPELNQAVENEQVDFVITNSGHYVYLEAKNHISRIATMIKYKNNHWLNEFGGVILSRSDRDDIQTINELKNRKIAAVDVESLGGYAAQMYELYEKGLDKDNFKLLFTGMPHSNVVQKVLSGEADAGFVRTEVLESMLKKGTLKPDEFKIINQQNVKNFPFYLSTELYPEWPIARMQKTPYDLANKVVVAFLKMNAEIQAKEGDVRWTVPLEYRAIHTMLLALHMPPYDVAENFTLLDIYIKYKPWVIILGIITFFTLVGILREFYLRKKVEAVLNDLSTSNEKLKYQSLKNEMMLRLAGDGVHILDVEGKVVQVSNQFCHMLGYEHDEMIGMSVKQWDDGMYEIDVPAQIENLSQNSELFYVKHRRKDGTTYDAELIITKISIFKEDFVYCSTRDITQQLISQAQTKLAAIVYENSSSAITIVDIEKEIISVNPAFEKLTGYLQDEIIGQKIDILKSGQHEQQFYHDMWENILFEGTWEGTIIDRNKDGSLFTKWLEIMTIYDSDQKPYRRVCIFSDKTDEKYAQEQIWHQSNFDALTDLPNRNMFMFRLEKRLQLSGFSDVKVALIYIDLDNFKEINDSMGHDKGDFLLIETTKRLKECIDEDNVLSRIGGDEFTVIMPRVILLEEIEIMSRKILESLSQPFQITERIIHITATIGISIAPDDTQKADILLKNAEQAMYAAKNDGRNRMRFFTASMHEKIVQKMNLIEEMRRAIQLEEFVLYYQPIMHLESGEVHKAEALIRWEKSDGSIVSPADFIPLAEETGLIVDIGQWVIQEACMQVSVWRSRYDADFQVSINKSPVQFKSNKYPSTLIMDIIDENKLSPEAIVVEITEGLLMQQTPLVEEKLLNIEKQGISLSLDDFGTGYSSLSYLKKFDIDFLKIDQSFVRNLEEDYDDRVLCEAIVAMAHKLNIKVIAEGVETEAQRDYLRSIQCDYIQGYLISRPIQAEEFEKRFFI